MSRIIHVCPDCHLQIDPADDGSYPLCPVCAVPMREEFAKEEPQTVKGRQSELVTYFPQSDGPPPAVPASFLDETGRLRAD